MIDLHAPAQIFAKLRGRTVADDSDFEAWHRGHPLAKVCDAQRVRFEWSDKHPSICLACQYELLRIVGEFFGFGDTRTRAPSSPGEAEEGR